MMYVSDYAVQVLHEDRLRDAERRRANGDLLRDVTEQSPVIIHLNLLDQIKSVFNVRTQPQEAADVRVASLPC